MPTSQPPTNAPCRATRPNSCAYTKPRPSPHHSRLTCDDAITPTRMCPSSVSAEVEPVVVAGVGEDADAVVAEGPESESDSLGGFVNLNPRAVNTWACSRAGDFLLAMLTDARNPPDPRCPWQRHKGAHPPGPGSPIGPRSGIPRPSRQVLTPFGPGQPDPHLLMMFS
jgi:hypothetical protein